jgi:hypothetical protein
MELYGPHSGETPAILEMVNGRRGALSKLLKLHLSPKYWDVDAKLREELIAVYAAVFINVISAGIDSGVEEIKIYGRDEPMFGILKRLEETWKAGDTGWGASIQGRWLAISKN